MSVCRSCLCNNLRLLTSCKPSLPTITLSRSSGNVPLRRYTAAPTASGQPASAPLIAHQEETAEEKEWNSFSLRNKVEHWIKMKDPEAARRLLQRARVPQGVYSWNLVIKYYAHQGNYTDAYKTYQQMKKCGETPIDDTYVQLAHAINSSQALSKHPANAPPPSLTPLLQLLEKLPSITDWTAHKGTAIFLGIISKALLFRQSLPSVTTEDEFRAKLVEQGKIVWSLIDPFSQETRLDEADKAAALTHYLFILSLSNNREDLLKGKSLLPLLTQFQTPEARIAAIRIAEELRDPLLAIKYWNLFPNLEQDLKSSLRYLRILSRCHQPRESTRFLQQLISHGQTLTPKFYFLALLSCMSYVPNLGSALKIYELGSKYPEIKKSLLVNQALLHCFMRATKSPVATKRHTPEFIYNIIRRIDMPQLLRQREEKLEERLGLVETALEMVSWRLDVSTGKLDHNTTAKVWGDRKFYERWREILLKERRGEDIGGAINQMNEDEMEKKRALIDSIDSVLGKSAGVRANNMDKGNRDKIGNEGRVDDRPFLESNLGQGPLDNQADRIPEWKERRLGGRSRGRPQERKLHFTPADKRDYSWEKELLEGPTTRRNRLNV